MDSAVTLGNLALGGAIEIGDGYRTRADQLGASGYQIIRAADVANGRVNFSTRAYVSTRFESQIGSKRALEGDVVLTTKGTVGRAAIMPQLSQDCVYSPQICYLRVGNTNAVVPRFLLYWLGSSEFWNQAQHLMHRTDMAPYISLTDLRSMTIWLPSVSSQEAIAGVLGALDDKLAANTQLVASSLDLVRALFRSTSRLTPSRSTTYGEIAQVDGGGTPSTKVPAFWGGQIRWATPTDITSLRAPYLIDTARSITSDGLAACSSTLFAPGAILMTSRATIGAFAVNQIHTSVNQGFIVVRPNDPHATWWLFHEMESRVDEYISRANGATFLELPRGRFRTLEVAPPRHDVLLEFDAKASAIHAKSAAAAAESRSLASLRDTLLPKLMSGELRVRDAEKQVEDVV